MSVWISVLNDLAALWAPSMGRACLQGGAAILLVWGLCRVIPRMPPSVHCWLWRLAYLKLLLAFVWATPVDLPLLRSQSIAAVYPMVHAGAPPPALAPAHPVFTEPGISWSTWLFLAWVLGVGCVGCRLHAKWRAARRSRRGYRPVREPEVLKRYAGVAARLGLREWPVLLEAGELGSPMLTGLLHPAVVVPSSLVRSGGDRELTLIFAHELVHFRRRDLWWNWLAVITHACFFFHPLLRLAHRERSIAQELACDEAALRATQLTGRQYAALLVSVSARLWPLREPELAVVNVVESYSGLRRRLLAVQNLTPWTRPRRRALGILVGVLALAGLVPWRVVAGTRVTCLDLQPFANQKLTANFQGAQGTGNDLASLPRGEQLFGGTPFRVGDGCIQLGGALFPDHPERVEGIPVNRSFGSLAILHAAGWGGGPVGSRYQVPEGTLIGRYVVHYAGGSREEIPITYGRDVRDWWMSRTEKRAASGKMVWTGQNDVARAFGANGIRLYLSLWKNPRPDKWVTHIDYLSTGTAAAPFCVAMTAED